MKCGHCFLEFESEREKDVYSYSDDDEHMLMLDFECPHCKRPNLRYVAFKYGEGGGIFVPVWPPTDRPPCPIEVPSHIAEDYREACLVLSISPKASAALSRRCLQNLLRDVTKVVKKNLADEINEVIRNGELPSRITESLDAVRHIGNIAAHPEKDATIIMPVEPNEAKWCLDILESLFDFYYVQPIIEARRRAALNMKFQEAGKQPPMK